MVNEYFILSQRRFDVGCYGKWQNERAKITQEATELFGDRYDSGRLALILRVCEETLSGFFAQLSAQGRRLYNWPGDMDEEMRRRISIALQQS